MSLSEGQFQQVMVTTVVIYEIFRSETNMVQHDNFGRSVL